MYKYSSSTATITPAPPVFPDLISTVDDEYLYILTAKHVAGSKCMMQVTDVEGKRHRVSVASKNIVSHSKIDMALIKASKPSAEFHHIKIGSAPLLVGEKIYTIGHPAGVHYSVRQGVVSAYSKRSSSGVMTSARYAVLTAPSYSGASGGAVVNTKNELVGIAVGLNVRKKVILFFMTYSVMLEDIEEFLYKNGLIVKTQEGDQNEQDIM
jgi:hypothetical protein